MDIIFQKWRLEFINHAGNEKYMQQHMKLAKIHQIAFDFWKLFLATPYSKFVLTHCSYAYNLYDQPINISNGQSLI